MDEQIQLLREQVNLLKQIRLLLLVLAGSIVLPILVTIAVVAFSGYWMWSVL